MSESTARMLKGLSEKLPRRTPKAAGSILGRPDPTAELAEHRLDDTELMPVVEDETQVVTAVSVADRLPEPADEDDAPQGLLLRVWNNQYADDMRNAAKILQVNGACGEGYFDFEQSMAGTAPEDCRVNLFGALSTAVIEHPGYVPMAIEGHLTRLAAHLGLSHFTAMWPWVEDHGHDEQRAALTRCADMLDPPAPVEPQDDGELEAPAPEVPADADSCETEAVES